MKLIIEPKVCLVSSQIVSGPGMRSFLEDHGITDWESDTPNSGEFLAETAGRLCYFSFHNPRPGGNKAYLEHILESSHGSVLEHAVWGFIITGVSRSFSHELVRHRICSYSQLSQRYVDESVAEYVVPPDLQKEVKAAEAFAALQHQPGNGTAYAHDLIGILNQQEGMEKVTLKEIEAGMAWLNAVKRSHETYVRLVEYLNNRVQEEAYQRYRDEHDKECGGETDGSHLDRAEWRSTRTATERTAFRKQARQAARSVLPNATETKIFFTANARALRTIIEQRCSRHAEPEIRRVVYAIWEILYKEAPNIFSDYACTPLPDGTVELTTKHHKV